MVGMVQWWAWPCSAISLGHDFNCMLQSRQLLDLSKHFDHKLSKIRVMISYFWNLLVHFCVRPLQQQQKILHHRYMEVVKTKYF